MTFIQFFLWVYACIYAFLRIIFIVCFLTMLHLIYFVTALFISYYDYYLEA